jgi:hypothetical protein
MPRVTHLLFLAAFIFADYLCLIQDSLTVFALASREMAVSPFLLVSIRFASCSFTRRRVVSAPVSCLSADASQHHGSVRWVEFPQFTKNR